MMAGAGGRPDSTAVEAAAVSHDGLGRRRLPRSRFAPLRPVRADPGKSAAPAGTALATADGEGADGPRRTDSDIGDYSTP